MLLLKARLPLKATIVTQPGGSTVALPTVTLSASVTTPTEPGVVSLSANATCDPSRTITKVEFFRDGAFVATVFPTPANQQGGQFATSDSNVAVGTYQYAAVVTDSSVATATSANVSAQILAVSQASPDGTKSNVIIEDDGTRWTLGAVTNGGQQTLRNNAWAGGGGGVIYKRSGGKVYVQNNTGLWYLWSGTWGLIGNQEPGVAQPPVGTGESADKARGSSVRDSLGRLWTLSTPDAFGLRRIMRDGALVTNNGAPNGWTATELLYYRKIVFMDDDGDGIHWKGWYDRPPIGDWYPTAGNLPYWDELFSGTPAVGASAHGVRGSAVTDAFGASWVVSGGRVLRNGVDKTDGIELTFMNNCVVVKKTNGEYWEYDGIFVDQFVFVDTIDPLAVENGTVDYGPVVPGLRGTETEAQLKTADPDTILYLGTDHDTTVGVWGFDPAGYDNLSTFRPWAEYGIDVVRFGWGPSTGPGMARHQFYPARDTAWLSFTIMPDADLVTGFHEGGIKLCGLQGSSGGIPGLPDAIDYRLWLRHPFRCLPRHSRLEIYPYEANGNQPRNPNYITSAYVPYGQKSHLDLGVHLNGFIGSTPKTDGWITVRRNNQTVLSVTGITNRTDSRYTLTEVSLENFHGGSGASFQTGMAIHAGYHCENGVVVVHASQPAGVMRTITAAQPTWRRGLAVNQAMSIPNTKMGFGADFWTGMGWGNGCGFSPGAGGHASYGNYKFIVRKFTWKQNVPAWTVANSVTTSDVNVDRYSDPAAATQANIHHFFDGRGTTYHHYKGVHLINQLGAAGKVVLFQTGIGFGDPPVPYYRNNLAIPIVFDIANGDLDFKGTWTPNFAAYQAGTATYVPDPNEWAGTQMSAQNGTSCKDLSTEECYFQNRFGTMFKWSPVTKTQTVIGEYGGTAQHWGAGGAPMWFDHKRGYLCAAVPSGANLIIQRLHVRTNVWQPDLNCGSTGAFGDIYSERVGQGFYDSDNDKYLIVTGGARALEIDPVSGAQFIVNNTPFATADTLGAGLWGNAYYSPITEPNGAGGLFAVVRSDLDVVFIPRVAA
jgi:hypothetical protein